MVGIRAHGAYVPMLRLPFAAIPGGGRKAGSTGGGERSVAGYDEDSVTMAVAAGAACLQDLDRGIVDGVLFASTTYTFREKQAASVVAKALDLRRDVLTADFADSLRAGTSALRSAADTVKAGSARNVLVVAADCRMGPPRSALEKAFGDGAAAFLIGDSDVAATLDAHHVVADEIIDVWRVDGQPFVRTWEDRFVLQHGYAQTTTEAIRGLLAKTGRTPADFSKAVLYSPNARGHAGVAKAAGFDPRSQMQDSFAGRLGNTGAAFAPMLLAAALEEAAPGQRLLLASYGDGAEVLELSTTERVGSLRMRRGMHWHLARRAELDDYDKFLAFRNLQPGDGDRRGGTGVSATVHYRERDQDIAFQGQRCRRCGTQQFPFQRVCFQCFAKDEFDRVRLSDRLGKVLSFTFDFFAGSPNPPLIVNMVEIEGGARAYLQMTDASPREVKLDLPVEFAFRKIHEFGGTPNYFWKCTPVR